MVAAHDAQLLPDPLMARLSPLSDLLTAENSEIARDVLRLPQSVQTAGIWALLMGRSFSNVEPQSAQRYSYIGMLSALTSALDGLPLRPKPGTIGQRGHPSLVRKRAYCTMLLASGQAQGRSCLGPAKGQETRATLAGGRSVSSSGRQIASNAVGSQGRFAASTGPFGPALSPAGRGIEIV